MSEHPSIINVAEAYCETSAVPEKMVEFFEVSRNDSDTSDVPVHRLRSMQARNSSSVRHSLSNRVKMQGHPSSANSLSEFRGSEEPSIMSPQTSTVASSLSRSRLRSRSRASTSSASAADNITALLNSYPVMQIAGTPFESQLSRSDRNDSSCALSRSGSIAGSSVNEGGGEKAEPDTALQQSKKRFPKRIVTLAERIKRGMMWQLIAVQALTIQEWHQNLRFARLCKVLNRHLVPVIKQRRAEYNEGGRHWFRRCQRNALPQVVDDDEGEKPTGALLAEYCPQLALFENPWLCELLASTVVRYRYSPGDAIVFAGSPAQEMLYILISGNCDAVHPKVLGGEEKLNRRRRLATGEFFGGFLGGRDTFYETFRSISTCVVWVLSRVDFEHAFDQCSTDSMRAVYMELLKEHYMKRLLKMFPVKENIFRVPIYRSIDRAIEEYAADFTPVVMTNTMVLFNQGDPPGTVYCLLEGEVCRDQLGPDMSYDPQTRQILSPNDTANTFAFSTRFVLLGEEPHILPHRMRYRCTVTSRAALFYRIEGERFVNAILDDPKLLLELRKTLMTRIRLSMQLSPEALLTVPILRMLPRHSLNVIANAAQRRVIERGQSICEQARNITEIFLITAGNLMDPRELNHCPTSPVPPPSAEEEQDMEGLSLSRSKNAKDRTGHLSFLSKRTMVAKTRKGNSKTSGFRTTQDVGLKSNSGVGNSVGGGTAPSNVGHVEQDDNTKALVEPSEKRWSFFNPMDGVPTLVHPDEQIEFTPLPAPNPARAIICTVGGGWEGLLIDKWPYGWETLTTVELWALPMLKIRTELASMPKAMQNALVTYVRGIQMDELGLSAPIIAKLPPISIYQPQEKRIAPLPALGQDALPRSSLSVGDRRNRQNVLPSGKNNDFLNVHSDNELSISQLDDDIPSSMNTSVDPTARRSVWYQQQQQAQQQQRATKRPARESSPRGERSGRPARPTESPRNRDRSPNGAEDGAAQGSPEPPKRKAGPPPLLYFRRLAAKRPEDPPVITSELLAIYAGKQDPAETGIVRSPPHVKKMLVPPQRPLAWPALVEARKQWFGDVPVFEPLPGTVNNQLTSDELPSLVTNTAQFVKRDKHYGAQLLSHAAYFACVAQSRSVKEQNKGELASTDVSSARSPRKVSTVIGQPAPGRHTYTL